MKSRLQMPGNFPSPFPLMSYPKPHAIKWRIFATPTCPYCGERMNNTSKHKDNDRYRNKDHVVSKGQEGSSDFDNLVYCCRRCNHEKGNMSLLQFMVKKANEKVPVKRAVIVEPVDTSIDRAAIARYLEVRAKKAASL